MLQVKDVYKSYATGELVQKALDGVSLNLREHELVAILGPSGSGKSTLLNVLGGLDQYDSGDLIINGISTKKYTDRDWDSYRNHTVGFVFQSYNLIPHQTVLANVELALTISGVSKAQRRSRAIAALEDVGLGNQLHKKPNQMSGGQMQRVAIARALVNNPSILLADEPTGALDSETSVQIMELLKEVSKDRLVVMVTHNPELADAYADRIVRVKDGHIIDDNHPLEVDETQFGEPEHKNMGKSSMSFRDALTLSFNNLKTKKGRTLMTAFAGSIGIIGIALIMSLSVGFQRYIDKVQEDTLANYPLTIQSETADMTAMIMPGKLMDSGTEIPKDTVSEQAVLAKMFAQIGSNDLKAFKAHLESNMDTVGDSLNAVLYDYGIAPRIFSANPDQVFQVHPATLLETVTGTKALSSIMDMNAFHPIIDNRELLDSQYQVLEGRWPEAYNELVFVLPSANMMPDYLAYTLGMKDTGNLSEMINQAMQGEEIPEDPNHLQWTYDDLMNLTFRLVAASDLYRYNSEYDVWEDMSGNESYMKELIAGAEELRVVGVVCSKSGGNASLYNGIGYHPSLITHVMEEAAASQIVQQQLAAPETDIFSGKPFGSSDDSLHFENLITVDGDAISSAIGMNISTDAILNLLENYLSSVSSSMTVDTTAAQQAFASAFQDFSLEMLNGFVAGNADANGRARLYLTQTEALVDSCLSSDAAQSRMQQLAESYAMEASAFSGIYKSLMLDMLNTYIAQAVAPAAAAAEIDPSAADASAPAEASAPADSVIPDLEEPIQPDDIYAEIGAGDTSSLVGNYLGSPVFTGTTAVMGRKMMEPQIVQNLLDKVSGFGNLLMGYLSGSVYVDEDLLASAFQFNMDEEELRRLFDAVSSQKQPRTVESNLKLLGYADPESPTGMSVYMKDFDAKEVFMGFLEEYNRSMEESGQENMVIRYTDMTGMMMDSVRTIVDSISYVLIAFVAVSLLVSSIMIGIITYISVMERTKEIGVLRAMGASKRNISQVFNAETFIIGLCSGLMGVGLTLLLLIPGTHLIHSLMQSNDITPYLPVSSAVILIVISMLLTLLGGLIPSKQAAKKDPVIALRSE